MRHRNHSKRLSQKPHKARMLLKNLLTSILLYENVRTTKKRAQVVRPMVDRVITVAKNKRKDLAIRMINQHVTDQNACRKVIEYYAPKFADRSSGFTRATPVGMRKGDGAFLVDISFVEGKEVTPPVVKARAVREEKPKSEKKVKAPAAKKSPSKKS